MSELYLTYEWQDKHQAYVAVITDSHPQSNGEITVLDVDKFKTESECYDWFHRMAKERPWEK